MATQVVNVCVIRVTSTTLKNKKSLLWLVHAKLPARLNVHHLMSNYADWKSSQVKRMKSILHDVKYGMKCWLIQRRWRMISVVPKLMMMSGENFEFK